MATVLCTWELGANLGHFSQLRIPIELALAAGHRVVVAARHLQFAHVALGGLAVDYMQAPFKHEAAPLTTAQSLSMGRVMAHQCFSSAEELQTYLSAWRGIFDAVRPDMVLFEHSPTAMIAAYGLPFHKVSTGNGFANPVPSTEKMPFGFFPNSPRDAGTLAQLHGDDQRLLRIIHAAQSMRGQPELPDLNTIFGQLDAQWLMTWPQLDHFGARPEALYLGSAPLAQGAAVQWPKGPGPRVFGYLGTPPSIVQLLESLQQANVCALLYARRVPAQLRKRFEGPSMRFIDAPVDLRVVASEADWVINQGNHSTLAAFALAGIPQLLIPEHQEHYFLTLRMLEHKAAAMAYQNQKSFANAVQAMMTHQPLREGANKLAQSMAASVVAEPEQTIRQQLRQILG